MRILVTGKNGQLGRCLSDVSKTTGWEWVFMGKNQFNLTKPEEISSVIQSIKPDVIVNTAAYTQVDQAEKESDSAFKVNRRGVENLIAAIGHNKTKIIHISTDYVFDGKGDIPFNEHHPVNPQSVYGRSKAEAEQVLLNTLKYGSYIVRTAWLYSEYGHNFVKTMLRLGKEKNEISVVNDQWGTPTYARDLAKGIIRIIDKIEKDSAPTGIYHYSNKNITSWFTFAVKIMDLAGLNCRVNPIPTSQFPTPAKRPAFSALNSDKFESIFNFAIRNWEDALEECIDRITIKP